jgi:hypothetical protein
LPKEKAEAKATPTVLQAWLFQRITKTILPW